MKAKWIFLFFGLLGSSSLNAQSFEQHFDGADTNCYDPFGGWNLSLCFELDTSSSNIWKIAQPNKNLFDSASTLPNALFTDSNYYRTNVLSSFQFGIPIETFGNAIIALRWQQKLDIDRDFDGAKIECSFDTAKTWQNVMYNPFIYSFYGFDETSVDTLPNGDFVFNGTDTSWRDIWLCIESSFGSVLADSVYFRFTFISDSIDNNKEGWMIDDFLGYSTIRHTVAVEKDESKGYVSIFPNPSTDRIDIQLEKIDGFHIIEKMTLMNASGQKVEEWVNIPTKFFIDARKYPNGQYFLRVQSNLKTETSAIMISHK